MRIGGAWIKQGDQGDFISVSIQIPFLGDWYQKRKREL